MQIILLGAPGSGKGTQAAELAKKLGLAHVSSGDLLREEQAKGTVLGKQAKSYMDRGDLVPDELVIRMILGRIQRPDGANGYVLDGFPRTLQQAQALEEALIRAGARGIDRVVYINVPDEELMSRLGGRWICRAQQHPYHVVNAPPKVAGRCDIDGSELFQRPDDSVEAAVRRLQVYHTQTAPLIEFYKGKKLLKEVNGEQSIPKVGKDLSAALQ